VTTTTLTPCKRPKVTIELTNPDVGSVAAICHVPRCRWRYPENTTSHGVKVDVTEHAGRHRRAHRSAVPETRIVHDVEWDVHCEPCGGHRRTFGTRADAEAWLSYHLSTDHGLVSC
jgi:hypothetical protein